MGRIRKMAAIAAVILAIAVLPLWGSSFAIVLASNILLFAIGVTSVHLLMRCGLVSLCHGGLLGIGAYTSVYLLMQTTLPFIVVLLTSGLVTAMVGLVSSAMLLRLSGKYFVLATFVFGEILRMIFVAAEEVTGGSNGIFGIPFPLRRPMSPAEMYYLIATVSVLCVGAVAWLLRSRFGALVIAVHDNERLARSVGCNTAMVKTCAFTLSCFLVGLQGSVQAHFVRYIDPTSFSMVESINFVIPNVIGGMGSLIGTLLGVIFFALVPEFLRGFVQAQYIVFGTLLVLFMAFLPNGLASAGALFRRRTPVQ
jgi:branched-chain amino acid transport system permease protein